MKYSNSRHVFDKKKTIPITFSRGRGTSKRDMTLELWDRIHAPGLRGRFHALGFLGTGAMPFFLGGLAFLIFVTTLNLSMSRIHLSLKL